MFVIQAIRILVDFEKSQTKFAKKTNISRSTISTIIAKEDSDGVSLKNIMAVINAYEDLNVRWFMTGEGPMWIEDLSRGSGGSEYYDEDEDDMEEKYESLKEKLELMEDLLKVTKQRVMVLEGALKEENPEVAKKLGVG